MERGELLKEYESIPKRRPSGECIIAQQPESADKNRFQDVMPYDNTRVELVPTKENNTGYINASHIKVSHSDSGEDMKKCGCAFLYHDVVPSDNSERTGVELHRHAGSHVKHLPGLLADGVGAGCLYHRHGYS